jgi:hypothetical protein
MDPSGAHAPRLKLGWERGMRVWSHVTWAGTAHDTPTVGGVSGNGWGAGSTDVQVVQGIGHR